MKQMLLHCAHEGADWETWLLHGKRLHVTTAMSLHCLLCSSRAPQKWTLDIWTVREEGAEQCWKGAGWVTEVATPIPVTARIAKDREHQLDRGLDSEP